INQFRVFRKKTVDKPTLFPWKNCSEEELPLPWNTGTVSPPYSIGRWVTGTSVFSRNSFPRTTICAWSLAATDTVPNVSKMLFDSWIEPAPFVVTLIEGFVAVPRLRIMQLLMVSEPLKPLEEAMEKPLPLMKQGLAAVPV